MGLELDLSELAALGPIMTAVGGARVADVDDGAACCVTPKTVLRDGESMAPRQDDGGLVVDDDDDAGCVTPTAARRDGGGGGEDGAAFGTGAGIEGFVTPTSAESALEPAIVCPPAPRKTAKRKSCGRAPLRVVLFPVPHDLDAVFVPLPPLNPPPSKKIRVHVVD